MGSSKIVDAAYNVERPGMRVGVNGVSVAPMESHDNLGDEGLNSIDWAVSPTMMKKRSVAANLLRCFIGFCSFVDYYCCVSQIKIIIRK